MAHQYHRQGRANWEAGLAEGVDEVGIQIYEHVYAAAVNPTDLEQKRKEEQQELRMYQSMHHAIWVEEQQKLRRVQSTYHAVWAPTSVYCEERICHTVLGYVLEPVNVIVDCSQETLFRLPLLWLVRTSHVFATWYAGLRERMSAFEGDAVYFRNIRHDAFRHFARWLVRGRITKTIIFSNATVQTVIEALQLGVELDCAEYQLAAMREFLALAPHIEWPEDWVNSIWRITKGWFTSKAFQHLYGLEALRLVHPMRPLLVAIVAAKTVGRGKRKIRAGRKNLGVDNSDLTFGQDFWVMYNEYRSLHAVGDDFECAMPENVEWFL